MEESWVKYWYWCFKALAARERWRKRGGWGNIFGVRGDREGGSLFKCHKDNIYRKEKDEKMETTDRKVATRTTGTESQQACRIFASSKIDQDPGRGRRGEALTRTEQLLSPHLWVKDWWWTRISKEGGEEGARWNWWGEDGRKWGWREWGEAENEYERVIWRGCLECYQSNIKWWKRPEN